MNFYSKLLDVTGQHSKGYITLKAIKSMIWTPVKTVNFQGIIIAD